jgi:hypothetical protein
MSTVDYITYTALFAVILATQLGTRHPSFDRLLIPVLIVGGIGFKYLKNLPGGQTSHLLELAGLGAGVLFGLAAIPLFRVSKDAKTGRLVTRAAYAYAALWLTALAMRLVFAYGSTHWFHSAVASFSIANHVPQNTYAAAFVLMVLTMIVIRTTAVLIRGHRAGADLQLADSKLLRRLSHHA